MAHSSQSQHDIFADRRVRRKPQQKDSCRRQDDFGQTALDSRPWWLKVNYVSHHLSIDPNQANN